MSDLERLIREEAEYAEARRAAPTDTAAVVDRLEADVATLRKLVTSPR